MGKFGAGRIGGIKGNQASSNDRIRGGEKLEDITVGKYKYGSVILNKYSATISATVSILLFVCSTTEVRV